MDVPCLELDLDWWKYEGQSRAYWPHQPNQRTEVNREEQLVKERERQVCEGSYYSRGGGRPYKGMCRAP